MPGNRRILSVTQLTGYMRGVLERDPLLSGLAVRGEVGQCTYASSGHIYFSLKDQGSVVSCVMFAGKRPAGLRFRLKAGMAVVVTGSVSIYEKSGQLQLYATRIEQEGLGTLYEQYERMKAKLAAEGLFDQSRKKPLPAWPRTIGVVTAATGAVIHDIETTAKRRDPGIELILCPAAVQGAEAVPAIVRGIRRLDAMNLDLIIVGRGGGSLEDLWAFNEEAVARAIAACRTPIISAVGHETDVTIADFAADLRAPTPTAAAELAVPDVRETMRKLAQREWTLGVRMEAILKAYRSRLENLRLKVVHGAPDYKIREYRQRLDEAERTMRGLVSAKAAEDRQYVKETAVRLRNLMEKKEESYRNRLAADRLRIGHAMAASLEQHKGGLSVRAARLDALSPLKRLSAGYAWLSDENGRGIVSAAELSPGKEVSLTLRDGSAEAKILTAKEFDHG